METTKKYPCFRKTRLLVLFVIIKTIIGFDSEAQILVGYERLTEYETLKYNEIILKATEILNQICDTSLHPELISSCLGQEITGLMTESSLENNLKWFSKSSLVSDSSIFLIRHFPQKHESDSYTEMVFIHYFRNEVCKNHHYPNSVHIYFYLNEKGKIFYELTFINCLDLINMDNEINKLPTTIPKPNN